MSNIYKINRPNEEISVNLFNAIKITESNILVLRSGRTIQVSSDEASQIKTKIDEISTGGGGCEEEIAALQEMISSLNEQILGYQEEIESLEEDITVLNRDKAVLNEQIRSLRSNIEELVEQINTLNSVIERLNGEKSELEGQIQELNNSIQELNTRIQDLEGEVSTAEGRINDAVVAVDSIKEHTQDYQDVEIDAGNFVEAIYDLQFGSEGESPVEPIYVDGWFEAPMNSVLIDANSSWGVTYEMTRSDSANSMTYTNGEDHPVWFNMSSQEWINAVTVYGGNKKTILALKLELPNCELTSQAGAPYGSNHITSNEDKLVNCYYSIKGFEGVTYGASAFSNCKNMNTCEFKVENTSAINGLNSIFSNCHSLQSLDLRGWDTSNVNRMAQTFKNCYSLQSINGIENWDTGNVTTLQQTFSYCKSFTDLDLSRWNTGSVTNMTNTFEYCYSLKSLDISNWNFDNVTSISGFISANESLVNVKIQGKPKTKSIYFMSNVLSDYSLKWIADNFIEADDTYTDLNITSSALARTKNKWPYFLEKMTAKGWTIN